MAPSTIDLDFRVVSKTLHIRSNKHAGDTVYRVEIDYQALRDQYGQCLGMFRGGDAEPVPEDGSEPSGKVEWEVKVWEPPRPRAIKAFQTGMIVYDPVLIATTKQAPTYNIKVYNYKELRVCLYKYLLPLSFFFNLFSDGDMVKCIGLIRTSMSPCGAKRQAT